MSGARVPVTVRLPDDLHRQVVVLAGDRRQSMSRVLEELVRRGLANPRAPQGLRRNDRTGLLTIKFGDPVTTANVRSRTMRTGDSRLTFGVCRLS